MTPALANPLLNPCPGVHSKVTFCTDCAWPGPPSCSRVADFICRYWRTIANSAVYNACLINSAGGNSALQVAFRIRDAAKANDPAAALTAYDAAVVEGIPLRPDSFNSLLYLCAGGEHWALPGDAAQQQVPLQLDKLLLTGLACSTG